MDKGRKGQNIGARPARERTQLGGEQPERILCSGRAAARRPQRPLPWPRLADSSAAPREEGKQARGGALERTGSGGRRQRCSPALTSIGGAAARRPRWRSGLASPRRSSAAAQGTRAWGSVAAALVRGGPPGLMRGWGGQIRMRSRGRRRRGGMQAQWRPHGDVVPDGDVEQQHHGAAREEVGPSAAG